MKTKLVLLPAAVFLAIVASFASPQSLQSNLGVSPDSLAFVLSTGDRSQTHLEIVNTGSANIKVDIHEVEGSGEQKLYWTETKFTSADSLLRSNLDGTAVEILTHYTGDPGGVALDEFRGRVYWVDYEKRAIIARDLDGANERVIVFGLQGPNDIAIDPMAGKLYWTDFDAGNIGRANLDGSGREILVQGKHSGEVLSRADMARLRSGEDNFAEFKLLETPWGIALDRLRGRMFWTDQNGDRVFRANLDGSGLEILLDSTLVSGPRGLAIETVGQKLYLVDSFNNRLMRTNLDGTGSEILVTFPELFNPLDLELDFARQQFFWSDNAIDQVLRAEFSGSNVTVIIQKNDDFTTGSGPYGTGLLLGTDWLSVEVSSLAIAPGGSAEVGVMTDARGVPVGEYLATIVLEPDDNSGTVTIPVSLTVTSAAVITALDTTVLFDATIIGTTSAKNIAVVNLGTDNLIVSEVSTDRSEFEIEITDFTLEPSARQDLAVTFRPLTAGQISGTLKLTSNAPARSILTIPLQGEALLAPEVSLLTDTITAVLFTGEQTNRTLTVINSGLGILTFSVDTLALPVWLHALNPEGTIESFFDDDLVFRFDATRQENGTYAAPVAIRTNDPDEAIVTVTAVLKVKNAPDISVAISTIDFGAVVIGAVGEEDLLIANFGVDTLYVDSVEVSHPDFSATPENLAIAPNDSSPLSIEFTPQSVGQVSATLALLSNDPDEPRVTIALSGEGLATPRMNVTPGSFEFVVTQGAAAAMELGISNTGPGILELTVRDRELGAEGDKKLYWTEEIDVASDSLQCSNLDGSGVATLFTSRSFPAGIAVDAVSHKLYWADLESGAIRRANLDGSELEIFLSNLRAPVDIAVDPLGEKIYWTEFDAGIIRRANLDGSEVETLLAGSQNRATSKPGPADDLRAMMLHNGEVTSANAELNSPWGIALDLQNRKLYWTEQNGNRIGRADLDGNNREIIISSGARGPRGIKVDPIGGKIYVVSGSNAAIVKAELDGSDLQQFLSLPLTNLLDLELDLGAQHVYWTDNSLDLISRADLDGSNVTTIIAEAINGFDGPFGIGLYLGNDWLRVMPGQGRLPAGQLLSAEVRADAASLDPGTYEAIIAVESNDPSNSLIELPVTLQVLPPPLKLALPSALTVAAGDTVTVPLLAELSSDSITVVSLQAAVHATGDFLSFTGYTITVPDSALNANVFSPSTDSVYVELSNASISTSANLLELKFVAAANAPIGVLSNMRLSDVIAIDALGRPVQFSKANGTVRIVVAPGMASGRVWDDVNENGQIDADEPGLAGWKLIVRGDTLLTASTDSTGQYHLALNPGRYAILEELQAGWQQTFPQAPGAHALTLESRQLVAGLNFGNVRATGVTEYQSDRLPTAFELHQNYPNPFNPVTRFVYGIPRRSEVKIEVFEITGKRVATLVDETQPVGYYELEFRLDGHAGGIYFYRMTAGEFVAIRKMAAIK